MEGGEAGAGVGAASGGVAVGEMAGRVGGGGPAHQAAGGAQAVVVWRSRRRRKTVGTRGRLVWGKPQNPRGCGTAVASLQNAAAAAVVAGGATVTFFSSF
jgi:hypothetical protein